MTELFWGENKWIKIQKWIELVGTECLDCPKVEGGVWEDLPHEAW